MSGSTPTALFSYLLAARVRRPISAQTRQHKPVENPKRSLDPLCDASYLVCSAKLKLSPSSRPNPNENAEARPTATPRLVEAREANGAARSRPRQNSRKPALGRPSSRPPGTPPCPDRYLSRPKNFAAHRVKTRPQKPQRLLRLWGIGPHPRGVIIKISSKRASCRTAGDKGSLGRRKKMGGTLFSLCDLVAK